jgi:hypothetical protein
MRFRTLIALASMTLLAAAPAHAVGNHEMGLSGGFSMPTGDFGDAANTGFNFGGEYQYMITNLGMGATIAYHGWGASDDMALPADTDMSFKAWQYSAYGVWSIPTPTMTPYFKAGGGWYSPGAKLESPSGESTTTDTNFGVMFGGGVDWNMPTGQRVGIGANYHRLKDSSTDFFSVSARMMWPLKVGL